MGCKPIFYRIKLKLVTTPHRCRETMILHKESGILYYNGSNDQRLQNVHKKSPFQIY